MSTKDTVLFVVLALASYFIGNFNAAVVLSKKVKKSDIRGQGSKNPGTTNMARTYGLKMGVYTLLLDMFKGLLCALAGRILFGQLVGPDMGLWAACVFGLAVILGHDFPVVHRFRGGKGFATGIGVFLAINPFVTIPIFALTLVFLYFVDIMSICAFFFFFLQCAVCSFLYVPEQWWVSVFSFVYLLLIILTHRKNIYRLVGGEEPKLGFKKMIRKKK